VTEEQVETLKEDIKKHFYNEMELLRRLNELNLSKEQSEDIQRTMLEHPHAQKAREMLTQPGAIEKLTEFFGEEPSQETSKTQFLMPMKYEITVGLHHILDDGTPIWLMDYKEYHEEESYFKAKPASVDAFKQIGFDLKWDDENHMAYYKVQGPQDQITAILAAEFLGRSVIGTMCFNDLIGLMITKFASLGGKMSLNHPNEDPDPTT